MTNWQLTSPDGLIECHVVLSDGALSYRVTHDGVAVLSSSPLGLVRSDSDFSSDLVPVGAVGSDLIEDEYTVVHGKQRHVTTAWRQLTLSFRNAHGELLTVEFRAFNDGLAFRYELPEVNAPVSITEECTGFGFASVGLTWMQATQHAAYHAPAYENLYGHEEALGSPADGPAWNMPALVNTADRWVLVAESGLNDSYFGGHLSAHPVSGVYTVVHPQTAEGEGYGPVDPAAADHWTLPWRVIVIGSELATIVESTIITDLADGPDPTIDYSWVQPGRVSWGWWSDHDSPKNLATLRTYIDLAADMGWEHSLVDANWNVHSDEDIRELVGYAKARGIRLHLWYNSGGPNNKVTEEPRDRMFTAEARDAEFARLASWGVAGVKVDFFHSDKQPGIALYHDILRSAAQHRVMVNFHGCTVPRGWQRTYPHLMSMEGVAGAEQYGFVASYPAAAPRHNAILPFTRNAIGSMDFTPVTFSDQAFPHVTTNAHELALAIVFESGLQHFADSAESYRSMDDSVQQFLTSVPTVWDETRLLSGYPGEHVVLARRHESEWFIAGINGTGSAITVNVDVSMLGEAMKLYRDGDHPRHVVVDEKPGRAQLEVSMSANGGFVAVPSLA